MSFFISDAWAQSGGGSSLISVLPLVLIFVVFYLLLIRPQQKRAKQHKAMVADLSKGDEIVTNGGTLGIISKVGEHFITLDITKEVSIKVQRTAIAQMMPKGTFKPEKAS